MKTIVTFFTLLLFLVGCGSQAVRDRNTLLNPVKITDVHIDVASTEPVMCPPILEENVCDLEISDMATFEKWFGCALKPGQSTIITCDGKRTYEAAVEYAPTGGTILSVYLL